MIPPRIRYFGNEFEGKKFRKDAHAQLDILKHQMAFKNLQVGARRVSPYPGVIFEITKTFNQENINIYVAPSVEDIVDFKLDKIVETFWFWYALDASVYPDRDVVTGALVFTSSGGNAADIDVDKFGNVLVVGFTNTRDFTDEDSELSNETIIIKYNNDGVFQSRKVLVGGNLSGTDKNEAGNGVAVDIANGGHYLTTDVYIYRNADCYDAGLIKYDSSDTISWKKRFTHGSSGADDLFCWGVDADASGNAACIGLANIYDPSSPWSDFKYSYGWIFVYDPDGTLIWSKQIGDSLPDGNGDPTVSNSVWLLDVDFSEDIVTCGTLEESNLLVPLYPAGLIVKLAASNGSVQWHREIEGSFSKRDGSSGIYATGWGVQCWGCVTDTDGSIYTISLSRIPVDASTGWYHYHVTKVSSTGSLVWQQYFETPYYDNTSSYYGRGQIAVGSDGVYVLLSMFPGTSTPATSWGTYIIKLSKDYDAVDPTNNLLWQRLVTVDLLQPEFASIDTGIILYRIKVINNIMYLSGGIGTNTACITIKVPASGLIGNYQGLVFTESTLPFYYQASDIPVHEDAGSGGSTPGYSFTFHTSGITLNTAANNITVNNPTDEDYTSPTWDRTTKIMQYEITKESN